ncbi:MAG: hypothetical protein AB1461_08975 [Thermodesulfobacteriota bacterium]
MKIELLDLKKEQIFRWFGDLFSNSISAVEGKKITDGKIEYFKQEFFKQFFVNFKSIQKIYPSLVLTYKGKEVEISSLASVAVLTRACLENYSIFFYIYRESKNEEDIYFKFWSWYREGLIRRQKFIISHNVEKQKEEKEIIDNLYNELKKFSIYNGFTQKQKNKFESSGKWYFHYKNVLIEKAGFSHALANNCYNFFSSYAHPCSSSQLQTSQADFEASTNIADIVLNGLFISAGLYLQNYSIFFDEVKMIINDKDKEFILTWCELGEELMK